MKPELILKADVLDIIFENRNKEYGAYALRRDYNGRLLRGLAVMFGVVLVFIASSFLKNGKDKTNRIIDGVGPDPEIVKVELKHHKIPEPPKLQRVASVQHTTPVIVKETDKTVPDVDVLAKEVAIGTETVEGPPATPTAPATPEPQVVSAPVEVHKEPEILVRSEIMPEFPGGEAAMRRFLQRNMRFEYENMEAGSRIEIRCRFVVDKDGKVTAIEIVKSAGRSEFDKEVARVVGKMPEWKPGIQNGRNVAVYFTLPVVIEVPEQ